MGNLKDVRELAEHNLLASLLLLREPEYVKEVSAIICPKDFHDCAYTPPMNQHYRIFIAMQTLTSLKTNIDQVTVATKLYESINESHGGDMGNRKVSDIAEMSGMISDVDCPLDYLAYAKSVHQLANSEAIKKNHITVPIERR